MKLRLAWLLGALATLSVVASMAARALAAPGAARKKAVVSASVFRTGDDSDFLRLQKEVPQMELIKTKDEREALTKVKDADAIIGYCTLDLLNAAPKVKWIQVRSAGVNDLLFENPRLEEALLKRDLTLTNARRIYGPEIADHAMALLLAHTRGIAAYVRRGGNKEWKRGDDNPLAADIRPVELNGRTALIVGFGGIGSEVAKRAAACGMRIVATDPQDIKKPPYVERIAKPSEFHKLLPGADVVFSCAPLTRLTKGMIGKREFGMMKKTAILINVSRGKIVDTDALVDALKTKQIAAAGLDVVEPEPLPLDHPLWKLDNVVISPHIAVQSQNTKERLFALIKENLIRFAQGEPLKNVVNKKAGY